MAELKDKEYSALKTNLENMGTGANKYQKTPDPNHPLPPNITQARYTAEITLLVACRKKVKDLEKDTKDAYDELQAETKKANALYTGDVRTVKGVYGIHSENLRDFGIQPEKKRQGKKPKKTTPPAK